MYDVQVKCFHKDQYQMTTWQRRKEEMSGYFQMCAIPWGTEDREARRMFHIKSWKREDACHKEIAWSGGPSIPESLGNLEFRRPCLVRRKKLCLWFFLQWA